MAEENLFHTNKIRTYTGRYIDVFNLSPDDIHIEDIARGLVHTCRFGGQLEHFYSVLEHSIAVATELPSELKVAGLMHDLSEAFIGDQPKPIKRSLTDYNYLEDSIMRVGANKFGFEYPLHPLVKAVDMKMLQWEWDNYVIGKKRPPVTSKEKLIEGFITLAEYFQTIEKK